MNHVAAGVRIDRGTVALRAEVPARIDLERVSSVLHASAWLGEDVAPDDPAVRRLATDLVLGVGSDRPVAFRKSMIIGLGQPRRDAGGWTVPIDWQAASLTPLFPVFVGQVRIDRERVAIEGRYAPPLGVVGAVLDRALLGIAARATAKVILARFVDALTGTDPAPGKDYRAGRPVQPRSMERLTVGIADRGQGGLRCPVGTSRRRLAWSPRCC